jgi:hypothetical protein
MKRECLMALIVLGLAGCATTRTPGPPPQSLGGLMDPASLSPNLSEDVTTGIQAQRLNSVIPAAR